MSKPDPKRENQRSEAEEPIVTIWLFRDRLRLKANPTITYRKLGLFVAALIAVLAGTSLSQFLEGIRQFVNLFGP